MPHYMLPRVDVQVPAGCGVKMGAFLVTCVAADARAFSLVGVQIFRLMGGIFQSSGYQLVIGRSGAIG